VFVLGPPPPKPTDWVEQWLSVSPALLTRATNAGVDTRDLQVAPFELRRTFWLLLGDVLREASETNGAQFVAAPPSALADDGSLRRDLCANDAMHGNARYGALVLDDLADHIGLKVAR
jgi:hypothetical protein